MDLRCERSGLFESGIRHLFGDFGIEMFPGLRRAVRPGLGKAHDCDECGEVTPDVDLWAEPPETGEQVWLCLACGDR